MRKGKREKGNKEQKMRK